MTNLSATDSTTLTAEDTERLTYRYERWRAVAGGIIETSTTTFLLLIAVEHFRAGSTAKAIVASGANPGFLFTPLAVYWVSRAGWRVSRAAAALSAFGATGFLAAALFPTLPVFIAGSMTGLICVTALVPLLTQMYQDNYLPDRRGRLFSNTIMIRIVAAAVFSWAVGKVLAHDLSLFRWLLVVFAGALLASSFCLGRCPSKPLARGTKSGLFSGLAHVRDDDLFRRTLISWMLMGFANLVIFQLRVEYMANPIYGEPISRYEIALLTGVIPNLARLVMSPVWGRLFDKMNFFTLRITLNMGFAIGALAFFAGRGVAGLVFGAIVLGIALAGGDVAWSLWVTKLAKPERVAEYMSVHTFLNGVRGVAAPVIGYYMLTQVSFHALSMMCAGLIGVASLMLIPEIKGYRAARLSRAAETQAPD